VFINEIHYDNAGSGGDVNEGVEVAGPAGTDLNGWSVVVYNGQNGLQRASHALSGVIVDEGDGFGAAWNPFALLNGKNGLALVDDSNTLRQFLSYEGPFVALGGPAHGMTSTDIGVAEADTTPEGESLQLQGTGSVYGHFSWVGPRQHSRGSLNDGQSLQGR